MTDMDSTEAGGVLICANPFSGSGPNRQYVDTLVGALSARGLEPRLVWDLKERQAVLSDPGLAGWCRCVVVAGGDGSIGAVVNELALAGRLNDSDGKRVGFATMPMGNENLFAVQFGFSRDAQALASAIHRGQTRRLDLGRVSDGQAGSAGRLFTLMAGVGFDAEVVHRVDRWRSSGRGLRRVSRLSYLPKILSALAGYSFPLLTVEVDGRELSGAHLFVFNLPAYGGGLPLAPADCTGDDGLLDWVLFQRPGVLPLLADALSVKRGRHLDRPGILHGKARALSIRSQNSDATPSAPVQIDGDPVDFAPIRISVADELSLELLKTMAY